MGEHPELHNMYVWVGELVVGCIRARVLVYVHLPNFSSK